MPPKDDRRRKPQHQARNNNVQRRQRKDPATATTTTTTTAASTAELLRRPYTRTLDQSAVRNTSILFEAAADAHNRVHEHLQRRWQKSVSDSSQDDQCACSTTTAAFWYSPCSLTNDEVRELESISSQLRCIRQELVFHQSRGGDGGDDGSATGVLGRTLPSSGGDSVSCTDTFFMVMAHEVANNDKSSTTAVGDLDDTTRVQRLTEVCTYTLSVLVSALLNDADQQLQPSVAGCSQIRRRQNVAMNCGEVDLSFHVVSACWELLLSNLDDGSPQGGLGAEISGHQSLLSTMDDLFGLVGAPAKNDGIKDEGFAKQRSGSVATFLTSCAGLVGGGGGAMMDHFTLSKLVDMELRPTAVSLASKHFSAEETDDEEEEEVSHLWWICADLLVQRMVFKWCSTQRSVVANGHPDWLSGAAAFRPAHDSGVTAVASTSTDLLEAKSVRLGNGGCSDGGVSSHNTLQGLPPERRVGSALLPKLPAGLLVPICKLLCLPEPT